MKQPARILIVDDHPLMRGALNRLLAAESDLIVAGEADEATEAFLLTEKLAPDLAMIDLRLKHSSGLDLVKWIQPAFPSVGLLVFSMDDDPFWIERALQAGASGYVSIREPSRNIIAAIRTVLAGRVYLNLPLTERILANGTHVQDGARSLVRSEPRNGLLAAGEWENLGLCQSLGLTRREAEVLTWVAQGKTNFEIGKIINARTGTICKHVEHILTKLKVENRTAAAAVALDHIGTHTRRDDFLDRMNRM